MSKDNALRLKKGEEILIQTKSIENKKFELFNRTLFIIIGIVGIILLIIGFFYLIPNEEYPLMFVGFYGFLIVGLMCLTTMITGLLTSYNKTKTIFYITSTRILKVRNKYFSSRKLKIYQVRFQDISHLIIWPFGVEIIPRKSNGEVYYKGDETEFFHKLWGFKAIMIRLNYSKGKKLINKISEVLASEVPLVQHPNIDFLFYQTQA